MSRDRITLLIERLGLAIHGEERGLVMTVLVAFVQTCCEEWSVDVEDFAKALRVREVEPDKQN